jgi:hypothetical protein
MFVADWGILMGFIREGVEYNSSPNLQAARNFEQHNTVYQGDKKTLALQNRNR